MKCIVTEAEDGQRLDAASAALFGVPRAQLRRWIDQERVRLNGDFVRAGRRVRVGDAIEADPPEPEPLQLEAEAIPLKVLFEDDDLIVIDKDPGLVVHPGPGHSRGTLVNALLHYCGDRLSGIGGVQRPGIVHRLDRGTSGVLVVAKTDLAHQGLSEQFRDHSIERVYLALVRSVPGEDSGRVDRPIGRHPRDRKKMSVRTKSGREAHTAWQVKERFPGSSCSLLEVHPETGRTHQIRVHLSSAGLPLVGDTVYGRARRSLLDRPALHAQVLGFEHPRSKETMRFEAPLPEDFQSVLDGLKSKEPTL